MITSIPRKDIPFFLVIIRLSLSSDYIGRSHTVITDGDDGGPMLRQIKDEREQQKEQTTTPFVVLKNVNETTKRCYEYDSFSWQTK